MRVGMKLAIVILLLGIVVGGGAVLAAGDDAELTFYFIGVSPGLDPFWAVINKGIDAAKESFPVKIVFEGLSDVSPTAFANLLDIAIAAKPDGIILPLAFIAAIDEACKDVIASGIPIIAVNTPDLRPENERIPALCFIGMDDRSNGQLLARETLKKVDITRALIGTHYPGVPTLEMRIDGIKQVLEAEGIPYDVLDITAVPSTAITVLNAYLIQHPETNVIFQMGEMGTNPTLKLIEEQGLEGQVYISTFDVGEQTIAGIKDGTVLVTISQQPYMQGFLPIQVLYHYVAYGIQPPPVIPTGPAVVDFDTVDDIEKQIEMTGGA